MDLTTVERAILTGPVRTALGRDRVEILAWRADTLQGGSDPKTGGVYRFTGSADDGGDSLSWSVVLKVMHPAGDDADPAGATYWKREISAYAAGLFADLPGVAAPRCLGSGEDTEGSAWVWLEEITDAYEGGWPLSCYGTAASHLGQFNGGYLVGRPLPAWPWLSQGWLGASLAALPMPPVESAAFTVALEQPLLRRLCPAPIAARLLTLARERQTFLSTLDGLPQTFCHHDAWRRNLFLREGIDGREQTVLIDWADAGMGAIGQDLAAFVFAPLVFKEIAVTALPALEELAWAHYLAGLREVGWSGDPGLARLGYTAAVAVRGLFAGARCAAFLSKERERAGIQGSTDAALEEFTDRFRSLLTFSVDRADEARELMGAL